MRRFAVLTVLLHRIGGRGAVDNVTEVLTARADADAQLSRLESRVARAA